jgi:flagellar protein FliL
LLLYPQNIKQRQREKRNKVSEGEEKKETSEPAKAGRLKKKLILVGAFIAVIAGALGLIVFLAPSLVPSPIKGILGMAAPSEGEKKGPEAQGFIYRIEPFLVNLADKERPRYLKIRMDLESRETKENEDYEKRLPHLRDAILTILTGKTFGEISDSQGKNSLKGEILQKVNQMAVGMKIKKIYFTEFVIQ